MLAITTYPCTTTVPGHPRLTRPPLFGHPSFDSKLLHKSIQGIGEVGNCQKTENQPHEKQRMVSICPCTILILGEILDKQNEPVVADIEVQLSFAVYREYYHEDSSNKLPYLMLKLLTYLSILFILDILMRFPRFNIYKAI